MNTTDRLPFTLDATCGAARATTFTTLHTTVQTPIFMPVATHAAMRGMDLSYLRESTFPIVLSNTYHLMIRPGQETIAQCGGLHRFMNWPRSLLTDSGGFQLFSLNSEFAVSEEGATIRSHFDGKKIMLSPESSIEMQRVLGSDIMMAFDECINSTSGEARTVEALERTYRWAVRSLAARGDSPQALFGIVQGGRFEKLRERSAAGLTALPFDGFALGGLAVGESKQERDQIVAHSAQLLPVTKPRYLMGVGMPIDLLEAVHSGIDMFDCIIPTALAQTGVTFTSHGRVDLNRASYKQSQQPLDKNCGCVTCTTYTRAYLHHLIKCNEFSAGQLLAAHNLAFYESLMKRMRAEILAGSFEQFYREQQVRLVLRDEENPPTPPKRTRAAKRHLLGDYEVVIRSDASGNEYGAIQQCSSGEIMHSVVNPLEEARELYLSQMHLATRLRTDAHAPLVIWDVGLGAATNAMAVVKEYEALAKLASTPLRPVHLISFECDLDSLRLAAKCAPYFAQLHHPAPHHLIEHGQWQSQDGMIQWKLHLGDFLQLYPHTAQPELIMYDPFSAKVDSPLWSYATFSALRTFLGATDTRLISYSASTAIRAKLLAAGFFVGLGKGSGPKESTTLASTTTTLQEGETIPWLGAPFLERWKRSDVRIPADIAQEIKDKFEQSILTHSQFSW